jgi:uncharacterized membrane protein
MTEQVQKLGAANGLKWLVDGFALFRLRPVLWIALAAAWLLLTLALVAIPTVGQLVVYLVTPALGAGLLVGCRALERGGNLEFAHLFAGFRSHPAPLVTIGGIYLLGNVLTFGAFMVLGGERIINVAMERATDPSMPPPDVPAAPLLSIFLLVPLFMAVTFAPALAVFRGMPALEALKASFLACLANPLPVLVFAVTSGILAIFAMLLYGLGTLIWIPVYTGAVYRGYQALFEREPPAGETPA